MLFAKYSGGTNQSDLFSVGYRLERRSERDLGLAETDVAAKKPVHNLVAFHIRFNLGFRLKLVVGGFELELLVELVGQRSVGRKRKTLFLFTQFVKLL